MADFKTIPLIAVKNEKPKIKEKQLCKIKFLVPKRKSAPFYSSTTKTRRTPHEPF